MLFSTSDLQPKDSVGQRFCELFGHYTWKWIYKFDEAKSWETEKKYPLDPRTLWRNWRDAAMQIGVRFGHQTAYAVLDIDVGSQYLKRDRLAQINEALETMGIVRTVAVRSSWSGGLHVYIPLPEPVKTFDFAVALKSCLAAHGLHVAAGQLEIFPNQKAYGRSWEGEFVEYMGHRLPLQPGSGSVLLNHALQPVGDSLERFFNCWDFAAQAQDLTLLHGAIAAAKRNRRKHRKFQTRLETWRDDLQDEIADGWTDFGQTNHLLKAIATFGRVFLSLSGQELATYTAERAKNSPGFDRWCRHQHEIYRKALSWARSVEGHYFPANTLERLKKQNTPENNPNYPYEANGNKAREWDSTSRILAALRQILASGAYKAFTKVTDWSDAIVNLAKCSLETLYKKRVLWHPSESIILQDFLELCVTPEMASDTAFNLTFAGDENPYLKKECDRLMPLSLTHLGGVMKSSPSEISHQKKSPQGSEGVAGGEKGYPQVKWSF
ncbi:MAG: hypothetical protein AAGG53_13000 [Cyanobacteria bacterium P01_H01_bin.152]